LSPLRLPISPPRCADAASTYAVFSAPAPPIVVLIMGLGAKSFAHRPRSLGGRLRPGGYSPRHFRNGKWSRGDERVRTGTIPGWS